MILPARSVMDVGGGARPFVRASASAGICLAAVHQVIYSRLNPLRPSHVRWHGFVGEHRKRGVQRHHLLVRAAETAD